MAASFNSAAERPSSSLLDAPHTPYIAPGDAGADFHDVEKYMSEAALRNLGVEPSPTDPNASDQQPHHQGIHAIFASEISTTKED